jgi:hypothetical protein
LPSRGCSVDRDGHIPRVRTPAVAILIITACGGAPVPEPPCVPATGTPSYLAGNWHAPVRPSDYTVDLVLEGSSTGICGTGHSLFGADTTGGRSFTISGTEQKLIFDDGAGRKSPHDVVRLDGIHIRIDGQDYVRQ